MNNDVNRAQKEENEKRPEVNINQIEPGMLVEATEADIGHLDISKPRITEVKKNDDDEVEAVILKKGLLFSKEIEVPAHRIEAVIPEEENNGVGKIVIAAKELEVEALRATGSEALNHRAEEYKQEKEDEETDGLLDQIEESIPTDAGVQRMEHRNQVEEEQVQQSPTAGEQEQKQDELTTIAPLSEEQERGRDKDKERAPGVLPPAVDDKRPRPGSLKTFGPGLISGLSGNDATAVTAYALDGARSGYSHLWLMLLATPLLQAVLYGAGKIGRISHKGLGELLREHFSPKVAVGTAIALIVANIALIAGDMVAVGSGLELITGLSWFWFILPVAALLWYITVYQDYNLIKKFFLVLSFAFVTYLFTALISGADWGAVISHTFIPDLDFSFDSLAGILAILGATISPYTIFWQVTGEKEEKRYGSTLQQVRTTALDTASGVISGNLIAYFIIVTTSATLFTHHHQIQTAADAASSLEPLAGPFARYLFAGGLIGSGLVAIPVLLASTAYALSGSIGLPHGLSKKPWQSEGFYLILTAALLASLVVVWLGFDPIHLMFWANILQTFLAPLLILLIILLGNNRKVMGEHCFSLITNLGLALAGLVLLGGAGLFIFGLVTTAATGS